MKVTVWNENLHEKKDPKITALYEGGIHAYIANFLSCDDIEVTTATLDDEECGLTEEVLKIPTCLFGGGTWRITRFPTR